VGLKPYAKTVAAAVGLVLAYVQTLITPTGLAAHIITAVILAGTALGVWAVPNTPTPAQIAKVVRDQNTARHAARRIRTTSPADPLEVHGDRDRDV
jgi:hypothetical protein